MSKFIRTSDTYEKLIDMYSAGPEERKKVIAILNNAKENFYDQISDDDYADFAQIFRSKELLFSKLFNIARKSTDELEIAMLN